MFFQYSCQEEIGGINAELERLGIQKSCKVGEVLLCRFLEKIVHRKYYHYVTLCQVLQSETEWDCLEARTSGSQGSTSFRYFEQKSSFSVKAAVLEGCDHK